MKLRKFLDYFEFDYLIDENDEIQLIDQTGTNLGDIQSERFPKENLAMIVDRLDIYYKDYIFDDLAEMYNLDQDDWQAIYIKAKEENYIDIDYMDIIMGVEELSLDSKKIVHHIAWDCDEEDLETLPKYITVPDCIDDENVSDYISDEIGFCHFDYKIGMNYMDCVDLLTYCIKNELLQFDETIDGGSILVYRTAGEETPEGWYWQNLMNAASEIYHNKESLIELIDEINK